MIASNKEIKILANQIIELFKKDKNFGRDDNVLPKYLDLYEGYIKAIDAGDEEAIRIKFKRIRSLSRAYLETSSDWDKEFLGKMKVVEKIGECPVQPSQTTSSPKKPLF